MVDQLTGPASSFLCRQWRMEIGINWEKRKEEEELMKVISRWLMGRGN